METSFLAHADRITWEWELWKDIVYMYAYLYLVGLEDSNGWLKIDD